MKRLIRTLGCAALTATVAVAWQVPAAHADDAGTTDGTITGGDISGPGNEVPPDVQEQARIKQGMADAYLAVKRGEGTRANYRAAAEAYARAYPRSTPDAGRGPSGEEDTGGEFTTMAAGHTLLVEHYSQNKSFYCGPASGKMILYWLQSGPSAATGVTQTQGNIGNADHMRTDINGKTGWDTGLFRIGLNKWRGNTYYVDVDKPTGAKLVSSLVYDIDKYYPLAADTVEFAGGYHYNGHPANQTIGHWIVGHGYTNYGETAKFADPSTSVWSSAQPEFTYDTRDFANRFLQHNGITW